jgi:hypothetical protein
LEQRRRFSFLDNTCLEKPDCNSTEVTNVTNLPEQVLLVIPHAESGGTGGEQ